MANSFGRLWPTFQSAAIPLGCFFDPYGIAGIVAANPPFDIYLPALSSIRIGDGRVVIAEGVRMVLHEAKPTAPIAKVQMHTMAPLGAMYQLTIMMHEARGTFGNAHTAVGMAPMNASGDHLTISNIGSSRNAGAAGPKMWATRTAP